MDNKQDYKEYRFDYTIYVNDFIICKRNFKIPNYIEGSMKLGILKLRLQIIKSLITLRVQ